MFEEWGTSGRIRPTIGHLLALLVRVELFRAADFVAVQILSFSPPPRPLHGPAAIIDTTIPAEVLQREIESHLDHAHYPNTDSLNANIPSIANNINRNYPNEVNHIDPYKIDLSIAQQQIILTQTNNNTNDQQQLNQMMDNFGLLSTNTIRTSTESRNIQQQRSHENCDIPSSSNQPNSIESSNLPNSVSVETQNTNVSNDSSISEPKSKFIPVMIGENGLRSIATISNDNVSMAQIPTVFGNENDMHSNHTESTDLSTIESEYTNSFIPLTVTTNGNSSQSNQTTQYSMNSESNRTMDSCEIIASIGENDQRSINHTTTTTVSTELNSSSVLIPLSVMSDHNGTTS